MLWVIIEKNQKYNHKYRHMIGDLLQKFTDEQIVDLITSMPHSCVLDVADEGNHTLQEIAEIMGLCHQRIQAMAKGINGVKGFLDKMKDGMKPDAPYRKVG